MEGRVRVRELRRCMVTPATPTPPRQHMYLAGLDMLPWTWPISRLFFYSLPANSDCAHFVDRLHSSLRRTLTDFYPCAGRLGPDPDNPARPSILCNDAGVEFKQACADATSFADLQIDGFRPCMLFRSLTPLDGKPFINRDNNKPLVSVQVTQFIGGGVALGITANHVISDGFSFWHFMNSWAECARWLPISRLPHHNRKLLSFNDSTIKSLDETSLEQSVDSRKPKDGVSSDTKSEKEVEQDKHGNGEGNGNARKELCEQLFHVTKEELANLKIMASEGEVIPTSLEALCAHFWRHVTKARGLNHEQKSAIALGVNIRSHMKPPLPPNYYGNATMFAIASATARELCSESVAATTSRIHTTLSTSTDDATIKNFINLIEHQTPNIPLYDSVYVADSPRFPMYEVDFGWGRPQSVRISHMYEDGEMACLAGARGDGSIDVCLALPHQHMERLLLDQQFLSLCPISKY